MKNLVKNIVLATIIGVAMLAVPSQVKADDIRVTKTGFRGEYKEGYMTQETDVKGADFSLSYYKNDTPQTEITYFKVVDEDTVKLVGWESNTESLFLARERHLQAIMSANEHLMLAQQFLDLPNPALDLIAEELRLTNDDLGEIVGETTPDDILGMIFSRFCIGK